MYGTENGQDFPKMGIFQQKGGTGAGVNSVRLDDAVA